MNAEQKEAIRAELKNNEKEQAQKLNWLNYLSVSTVVIALCATLSTYKGGGYSSKAMLSQIKASDQWAFYQSKSIKEYLYQLQLDNLQADLLRVEKPNPAFEEATQKRIKGYTDNIARYKIDKEKLTAEAHKEENTRDECKKHSDSFGVAVIFLQLAILLSSIAALIKKKPLWYASMALGLVGIFYFINGFLLFI